MDISLHLTLLIVSVLLFSSILLSRFTARLGVPTLLGFLLIGLLFGNGGRYDFVYDYPEFTLNMGQIALCVILFTGGLNTDLKHIRPIIPKSLSLSVFGVAFSTLIIGFLGSFFLPLNFTQCLLLGAIISSTDAAAVFSILEAKGMKSNTNQSFSILEVESGTNDPMAYFLTVSLTFLILGENDFSIWYFLGSFLYNMIVGGLIGYIMGYLTLFFIKQMKLKIGLNPVLILTLIFFTFAFTELVHGNSFLAVYITGILVGNRKMNNSYITHFFEGISWLMEILLFLTLGLQVFIQDLPVVLVMGLSISAILIFIARPISIFLCLSFFKINLNTKAYISWVGLRGATPIVFALYPVIYAVPEAKFIFNIAFFVVFSSILLQGSSIALVAKWLKIRTD